MDLRNLLGIRRPPKVGWDVPNGVAEEEKYLVKKYRGFTGASRARLYALINAVNYVDENDLRGDIVECGVYRGANPMMVKELRKTRLPERTIYLFDTFEGMTRPTDADIRHDGASASSLLDGQHREGVLSICSIEDVKQNFTACGLDLDGTKFVKGPVEQTLLDEANLPKQISVLRLDTDWYESTKIEMEVLYPRLAPGGVLIIDDYGCWRGSRTAVDEYFADKRPLLSAVDGECRIGVKPNNG